MDKLEKWRGYVPDEELGLYAKLAGTARAAAAKTKP